MRKRQIAQFVENDEVQSGQVLGDGSRPELQALFERLAIDPRTEILTCDDRRQCPELPRALASPLESMTCAEIQELIVELEKRLRSTD